MADDTVMEEREELMVSPSSGEEHYRNAHFLKPSATTFAAAAAPSTAAICKGFPVKVNSPPWACRSREWKTWVEQMLSSHHSTWKKAGILDAIIISTYSIPRCEDLIFGLSEKWSPTTNSFVFPWGEATITLEDMMALAGYSVLGEPVFITTGDAELENKVTKLLESRSQFYSTRARRVFLNGWMAKFMGSGSEIEHEAFLAYWLSKFVFPYFSQTIGKAVIPIAVQLASGTRIALAPAVLASIYRALTLMKEGEVQPVKRQRKTKTKTIPAVSAPLALVQVWAWERLPLLHPKPVRVGENEPRIARWAGASRAKCGSRSIYSAGENMKFRWRPYASDGVFWERVENEELESFVRCVRVSKLVGLGKGYVEQYLPHRVAMQFGMDQDLPGRVAPGKVDPEIAWTDYIRPIGDGKVYVPPRVYKPCVTSRYLEWWKKLEGEAAAITEQLDVDVNANVVPPRCVMRRCTSSTAANAKSTFGGRFGFKISKRKYLQQFRRQRNVEFEPVPQSYSAATNACVSSESSEKSRVSSAESSEKSYESSEKSLESSEKLMHAPMEASESEVGCEIEGNHKEVEGEHCLLTAISNEASLEKWMPARKEASGAGDGCEMEGNNRKAQGRKCLFSATSHENAVNQSEETMDRANGKMDLEGLKDGIRIVEKTIRLIKAGKLTCYIPPKHRKVV